MNAVLCAVLYAALVVYAIEWLKGCAHCRWLSRDTTGASWVIASVGASLASLWLCDAFNQEGLLWTLVQQLLLQQLIFDGVVRKHRGPYR